MLVDESRKWEREKTANRPLCLFNAIARITETIISERSRQDIAEKGGLAENQFCFRKRRMAVQVIQEVTRLSTQRIQ